MSENAELKSRVEELERYNTELEIKVPILEQTSSSVGEELQNDNSPINGLFNFNSVVEHHGKPVNYSFPEEPEDPVN